MQPIKLKDVDFLPSDPSLFTLVDKAIQTDPRKPLTNAVLVKPDKSKQSVYYESATLSKTEIVTTSSRTEILQPHKNEIISANSSLGSFLCSRILQRESGTKSNIRTWKLDETEKEYPNSGYVYIPCTDTENVSNNDSVIILNQHISKTAINNDKDALNNNQSMSISKQQIDARDNGEKELEASSVKSIIKQNYYETNNRNIKENIAAKLLKDIEEKDLTNTRSVLNVNNQNYPEIDRSEIKKSSDINFIRYDEAKEITDISFVKIVDEQNYPEIDDIETKENNKSNFVIVTDEKELDNINLENNIINQNHPKTHDSNQKENDNAQSIRNKSETDPETEDVTVKKNTTVTFIRENGKNYLTDIRSAENINDENHPITKDSNAKDNTNVKFISNPIEHTDIDIDNSQETKNTNDLKDNTDVKFISDPIEQTDIDIENSQETNNTIISKLASSLDMTKSAKEKSGKELKVVIREENNTELCKKETNEKINEVNVFQKSSTILARNFELECTDEFPDRDTNLKNSDKPFSNIESTQKIEPENNIPFVDEMRLNEEFISEDYVFNDSGQQPLIDLDDNAEGHETLTLNLNSGLYKLNTKAPDDLAVIPGKKDTTVNPKSTILNISNDSGNEEQRPPNTNNEIILINKFIERAGSILASYFQTGADINTPSEVNTVHTRDCIHTHGYIAPPSVFTTVKSRISEFLGLEPAQPTLRSVPSSAPSSDFSFDTTDDEDTTHKNR